jgi:hypothetical protein
MEKCPTIQKAGLDGRRFLVYTLAATGTPLSTRSSYHEASPSTSSLKLVSMTTIESYVYHSLPSGDFIRLLILEPGTDDEVLKGTLHIAPLDEVQVFEAISYVWGSSDKACTILCNERTIRITANLRDTLKQVRLSNERRILWADSICINQSDSKEKGSQVGLMWKIYSKAETVLVCVGVEECGNGPHVVSLLADMNVMIEDTFTKISLSPNTFPFPDEDDPLFFDERWKSLTALIRCPWFQRGWVVQEAGLAERAQILWGAVKIDWNSFLKTLFWLTNRAPSLMHKFEVYMSPLHLESMAKRNKRVIQTMYVEEPLTALHLLSLARDLKLTDERDRVYAFAAFAERVSQQPLRLILDYDRSFLDIYQDFAREYLISYKDLDLLNYVQHNDSELLSPSGPTSWVPRWDVNITNFNVLFNTFPKLTSRSGLSFDPVILSDSVLRVRGVIFDSVHFTSDCMTYETDTTTAIAGIWNSLSNIQVDLQYPQDYLHFAFYSAFDLGRAPPGHPTSWPHDLEKYLLQLAEAGANFGEHVLSSCQGVTHCTSKSLAKEICQHCGGRRFLVSDRGYFGLGPGLVEKGDLCCIIFGAKTPFILRCTAVPGQFRLVGEAYIISKKAFDFNTDPEYVKFFMLGREETKDWVQWDIQEQDIIIY